jgi:hypothetical protein
MAIALVRAVSSEEPRQQSWPKPFSLVDPSRSRRQVPDKVIAIIRVDSRKSDAKEPAPRHHIPAEIVATV